MKNVKRWALAAVVVLAGGIVGWAESIPVAGPAMAPPPPTPVPVAGPRGAARGVEVYRSAFEKEAGTQWSKNAVTKSPSGKHTFLGPLGYDSAVLTLDNLPEHARVRVSFDVVIMLSWDGDANLDQPNGDGPDLFDVTVDRGPRLVHASFLNRPPSDSLTQSFPGRFPYDHFPAGTGAAESGTLGYHWPGNAGGVPDDWVYHFERSFAHSGKALKIAFSGINVQETTDEAWGLENVRVEVLPEGKAGALDEAAFGKLWGELGSEDPKAFVAAIDGLIEMGDVGVAAMRKRLAPPVAGAAQELQIAKLIAALDADAYTEREKATDALRELGAAAEPALRAAREKTKSLEVRVRIDALLDELKGGGVENEAGRRLRRAVEVLELVGTEAARGGISDIAGRSGSLAAWEAKAALERLEGKAEIPTKLDLPPGLPKRTPVVPVPVVEPLIPRNVQWNVL